jgi:threonylcarbamoyladenosine tRNA methylthiotransferase MtaB
MPVGGTSKIQYHFPTMRTFHIETLGCKVNQYESEQVATLLRDHGLTETGPAAADLRVVNTCSVTIQAASKSRQTVRRRAALPVLGQKTDHPMKNGDSRDRARVVVMGCWATSDKTLAEQLPGVSAVLGHHDNVAAELNRLIESWILQDDACGNPRRENDIEQPAEVCSDDGWKIKTGVPAEELNADNKSSAPENVKENPAILPGTGELPLLDARQTGHQRAFLKIQDGCDAHCTYCIIPRLRPNLWSKPVDDAVAEARRLVASGHVEIVLTGIFMGAYGQPTALRRRQPVGTAKSLGELIEALSTRVPGLKRLRLSSLEPGDLTADLISNLKSHPKVVPHFHLPLQSGSDEILRRMNRQYTRDDFARMIDRVNESFDRPAITTDIIVGFPGESDQEFNQTLEMVDHSKFIHIHAFPFSPRPKTAAARWTKDFIHGPVVNDRINQLTAIAEEYSHEFRKQFLGEIVEVLVERPRLSASSGTPGEDRGESSLRHGRCERYFEVRFDDANARPGDAIRVRIESITLSNTSGSRVD